MPRPLKKDTPNKKSRLLEKMDRSASLGDQKGSETRSPFSPLGIWTSPVLFAAALFFIFTKKIQMGEFFGVIALVFQFLRVYREQMPSWMKRGVGFFQWFNGVWLVLVLWLAFCAVTATFPNFSWLVPVAQHFPFQQSLFVSFILFFGMVGAFRLIPEKVEPEDLSSWTARFWLFICLGVGAYLSLYRASVFAGTYWGDVAWTISRAQHIVDLADYKDGFVVPAGLTPVWPYMEVFIWHLFPDASALMVQRLAGAIFDLGTLWALYFAGKEIGGRRLGLLAAGLVAVSKPLIAKCAIGYSYIVQGFGMALAIWFTLRLLKKPSVPRFLQWGAIVAFGVYTGTPFQTYAPFFVFIVLIWLLLEEKGGKLKQSGPLVWITALVLAIFFLYSINAFPNNNWISWLVDFAGPWFPCMVLGVVLTLGIFYFPKMASDKKNEKWTGWVAGAWLCVILSFPILMDPYLFERIKAGAITSGGFLNFSYIWVVLQRLVPTIQTLFWGGEDRNDMALPGDAFFSYPEVVIIALGLAFCLARMNLWRGFLLLTAIVAFLPHVFSAGPHSGRFLSCAVPFLLLGAVGLNELLKGFIRISKSRIFYRLAFLLVFVLWGWAAKGTLSRVYDQWAQKIYCTNVLVYLGSIQDQASGYRVYLDPQSFSRMTSGILFEGHPVHFWYQSNVVNQPYVVYMGPNENPSDLVIYTNPGSQLKTQIEKTFPKAQWTMVKCTPPFEGSYVYRCFLSLSLFSIKNYGGAPFIEFRRVSEPYWDRQYASSENGLIFSALDGEDKTLNINDPVPPGVNPDREIVKYSGVIHVNHGGKYEITCKTGHRTEVQIDGQKIFNLFFPMTTHYMAAEKSERRDFSLEAGDHQVEVKTWFQGSSNLPDITFLQKGIPGEGQSLWTSFNF